MYFHDCYWIGLFIWSKGSNCIPEHLQQVPSTTEQNKRVVVGVTVNKRLRNTQCSQCYRLYIVNNFLHEDVNSKYRGGDRAGNTCDVNNNSCKHALECHDNCHLCLCYFPNYHHQLMDKRRFHSNNQLSLKIPPSSGEFYPQTTLNDRWL